jgi:simple sugar transport system ATP-binding protein
MLAPIRTPDSALSLVSLSKRFGATQALDEVDLTIARGEVVALMGANGAGKSTLAKIVSGAIKPDRGRIVVAGREVRSVSPHRAREAGVVVVHQSTDQLGVPGLTVAENLLLDQLCGGDAGPFVSRRKLLTHARSIAADASVLSPQDRWLARQIGAKMRAAPLRA